MRHVILTMGLNELPVLIAAWRLCRVNWEDGKPLPRFSILCSGGERGSIAEARRVRELLAPRLVAENMLRSTDQLVWKYIQVDADRPLQIRQAVDRLIQDDRERTPDGEYTYHLHYTGGTAAMGVHATEALLERREALSYRCQLSYLSAEEHVLRDRDERILRGQVDERNSWRLSIGELVKLHGFDAQCAEPPEELVTLGRHMTEALLGYAALKTYSDWLERRGYWDWKGLDGRVWNKWPEPPSRDCWPEQPIPWVGGVPGAWEEITAEIRGYFGADAWHRAEDGAWSIHARELSDVQLKGLRQFLHHQCLELSVYYALRGALPEDLRQKLWHSVVCRRGQKDNGFEVDVAAVLGYELVAVSCSMTGAHDSVKRKAFEIMSRARSIGGSNARGIVVSLVNPGAAQFIKTNLADDLGGRDKNVEIWPFESESALQERFERYIQNNLKWRSGV